MNRMLLTQIQHEELVTYNYMYTGLEEYRKVLLEKYPEMERWMPENLFQLEPIWKDKYTVNFWDRDSNNPGYFLSANLDTPTTVLKGCATPQRIITELKKAEEENFPYTHVGFSVFVEGYSYFIKCAQTVKDYNKNIITIGGNVGCLFDGTEKYVDYVCKGDGVSFLRKLLGEDINNPYNLVLVPSKQENTLFGMTSITEMVQITTKLGCPMDCDFCVTRALFQGKYTPSFFTPRQVHKSLVEYRETLKKDFISLFCEPTAITSKKWWYELFDLFKDEPYDYPIQMLTTAASLHSLDLDRISKSSLRISAINIGVESFEKSFTKNQKHQNTKSLIRRLADYGIGTLASFIVGFDHHDHTNVWEEVRKLVDLDAMLYLVLNLKPLPGTSTFNKLKQEGRLLDIPPDFFYIDYFQSFIHPHFKPGFEDMVPLLYEINQYIERETGHALLNNLDVVKNLYKQRTAKRKFKFSQRVSTMLFPSWKEELNPSSAQIEKYKNKLGKVPNKLLHLMN